MAWRITKQDAVFFRKNLWKDERIFPLTKINQPEVFAKNCFDTRRALLEFNVLKKLSNIPGEPLCPKPIEQKESIIYIDRVDGIRLYDLIRYLSHLELKRRDGKASNARSILMNRSRVRLAKIQQLLYQSRDEFSTVTYPIYEKIVELLTFFIRILGISHSRKWLEEVEKLGNYWEDNCNIVPFRDATVKNTLVLEQRLRILKASQTHSRRNVLNAILSETESDYWENIPLMEIDFSSVEHLTAPEDDPISLHCHEWTFGSCPLTPEFLQLLQECCAPDPYRSAAALLVRYLRFGGRKLAYKIMNSQGFEIRFQYDNPLFYFKDIKKKCDELSSNFTTDYSYLLSLVELIGYHASRPTAADLGLLKVDHFRRFFRESGEYWQENPIERDN